MQFQPASNKAFCSTPTPFTHQQLKHSNYKITKLGLPIYRFLTKATIHPAFRETISVLANILQHSMPNIKSPECNPVNITLTWSNATQFCP